ncbi:hypothetical protein AKJ16_DCAP04021 [Drosera capensis]
MAKGVSTILILEQNYSNTARKKKERDLITCQTRLQLIVHSLQELAKPSENTTSQMQNKLESAEVKRSERRKEQNQYSSSHLH